MYENQIFFFIIIIKLDTILVEAAWSSKLLVLYKLDG